jgi:hypothetical protein
MAYTAQHHRGRQARRAAHSPLWGPLLLFAGATALALGYVGYVLWPRWPEAPVARDAPSMPIVIADISFNIEPAAIRNAVQRRPGTQGRIDLVYRWPSLAPPDPAGAAPAEASQHLFVTIRDAGDALPPQARARDIYPRYLAAEPAAGPDGLTLKKFRDDTPYRGEELAFDPQAPAHFLARCTLQGVSGSGTCLTERRIGQADITVRFPRDWLDDWRGVAAGIDRLLKRLHPG